MCNLREGHVVCFAQTTDCSLAVANEKTVANARAVEKIAAQKRLEDELVTLPRYSELATANGGCVIKEVC